MKNTSLFVRLSEICNGKASREESYPSRKLFAIVLQGSESERFGNSFKQSMENILLQTPEDMEIITFFGQPMYWKRVLDESNDSRKLSICADRDYEFEYISALKKRLGISEDACILLTDNLLSKTYYVIPTFRRSVADQLISIGQILKADCDVKENLTESSDKYSINPENYPQIRRVRSRQSIGRSIMEIMALWAIDTRDESQKKAAGLCIKNTLKYLKANSEKPHVREETSKAALDRYSDYYLMATQARQRLTDKANNSVLYCKSIHPLEYGFDDLPDELPGVMSFETESGNRNIFGRNTFRGFQLIQKKEKPFEKYLIHGNIFQDLENISKKELSNYNYLLPFLIGKDSGHKSRTYKRQYDDFLDVDFEIDLKPLGAHLANIIEEEMNASVIQLIRTIFGIDMSAFYRLFDRSKDWCAIKTFGKDIYFNKRNEDLGQNRFSVKPVMMGDLGCVLRNKMTDERWMNVLTQFCEQQFVDDITVFAKMRNESSHAGTFGPDEFDRLYRTFMHIRDEYLQLMFDIKHQLKYYFQQPLPR